MRRWWLALGLVWLVGCATFEQTPQDLERKLSEPTKGHLYERDPLRGE
jgi:hypothetical protein